MTGITGLDLINSTPNQVVDEFLKRLNQGEAAVKEQERLEEGTLGPRGVPKGPWRGGLRWPERGIYQELDYLVGQPKIADRDWAALRIISSGSDRRPPPARI